MSCVDTTFDIAVSQLHQPDCIASDFRKGKDKSLGLHVRSIPKVGATINSGILQP